MVIVAADMDMVVIAVGLATPMGAATALVLAAVPTAVCLVVTTEERGSWISLAIPGAAQ